MTYLGTLTYILCRSTWRSHGTIWIAGLGTITGICSCIGKQSVQVIGCQGDRLSSSRWNAWSSQAEGIALSTNVFSGWSGMTRNSFILFFICLDASIWKVLFRGRVTSWFGPPNQSLWGLPSGTALWSYPWLLWAVMNLSRYSSSMYERNIRVNNSHWLESLFTNIVCSRRQRLAGGFVLLQPSHESKHTLSNCIKDQLPWNCSSLNLSPDTFCLWESR